MALFGRGEWGDGDIPILDGQGTVGRDHVDVIRPERRALLDADNREWGRTLQHLREAALVIGRQVQDDDERRSGFGRDTRKKMLERGDASGRGPKTHHDLRDRHRRAFSRGLVVGFGGHHILQP